MLNLTKGRFWYFLASGIVILVGLISLIIPPRLKLSIEFTSGSTMTLQFENEVRQDELRAEFQELGYGKVTLQRLEGGQFFVRTPELSREEKDNLEKALSQRFGKLTVLDFYVVSPIVAREIVRDVGIAIIVASIGILLYIAWAFRRVPRPFRWSSCAVIALLHDVLVVLGIFSIMGKLLNVEVDALFITAMLAIIGYSINNTVVVFDRLRENMLLGASRDFETVVNLSVVQTLGRCLNTSLTTLIALIALLLFGGATIHNFILALTIGIVAGAYNSLFIAPMLLLTWEKGLKARVTP